MHPFLCVEACGTGSGGCTAAGSLPTTILRLLELLSIPVLVPAFLRKAWCLYLSLCCFLSSLLRKPNIKAQRGQDQVLLSRADVAVVSFGSDDVAYDLETRLKMIIRVPRDRLGVLVDSSSSFCKLWRSCYRNLLSSHPVLALRVFLSLEVRLLTGKHSSLDSLVNQCFTDRSVIRMMKSSWSSYSDRKAT